MSPRRHLALPLAAVILVGLPVFWAFPEDLAFWRSVAIVCGWLGWGLLLVSLLLMIRESWLAEWMGGLERMYRWHHRSGTLAYLVLLLHPLALSVDAWSEAPSLAWPALSPLRNSLAVQLGWASLLAMMLGLALAFSRALAYDKWRWLHLSLAAAVVLAILHLVYLGLDDWLLWVPAAAIALMLWRFLRSDSGQAAHPYVVTRVDHPAHALIEVSLRPLATAITARPGQFVLAAFADAPSWKGFGEYHPFSLSRIGKDGEIAMGIKALGDCTTRLQHVQCGFAARVQGPFGAFLADAGATPGLWVAGGIGITPFLALLRARPLTQPTRLIYLYRESADAAYIGELDEIAAGQDSLSLVALATGASDPDIERLIPDPSGLAGCDCYLCGPPGLLDSAIGILAARGVAASRIHFERFDFR